MWISVFKVSEVLYKMVSNSNTLQNYNGKSFVVELQQLVLLVERGYY